MIVHRTDHLPVTLDCGCSVVPAVLNGGEPHDSGGALVFCPDHGIRFAVTVVETVLTVRYESRRLDPADPRPEEEVAADA